jgi:hypothetical protein
VGSSARHPTRRHPLSVYSEQLEAETLVRWSAPRPTCPSRPFGRDRWGERRWTPTRLVARLTWSGGSQGKRLIRIHGGNINAPSISTPSVCILHPGHHCRCSIVSTGSERDGWICPGCRSCLSRPLSDLLLCLRRPVSLRRPFGVPRYGMAGSSGSCRGA